MKRITHEQAVNTLLKVWHSLADYYTDSRRRMLMKRYMTRTPSYITSLNYHDPRDRGLVDEMRRTLKQLAGPYYRIKLQGRLGVDNPNAAKYRARKSCQCIRLADSGYVDVYLYTREYIPGFDLRAEIETLLSAMTRCDDE